MRLSELIKAGKKVRERRAELSVKGYLTGVQKALTSWQAKEISEKDKKGIVRIKRVIDDVLGTE